MIEKSHARGRGLQAGSSVDQMILILITSKQKFCRAMAVKSINNQESNFTFAVHLTGTQIS